MRRLLACGLALALAVLAVTTFARTPEAQTADRVLEACAPGKQTIDARALPAAVVDPGRCPVAGRRSPEECRDAAYQSNDWRVVESLGYRINHGSIPPELSRVTAEAAIRRAGGNITGTDNGCKMGDRVSAVLNYNGDSEAQAIGPFGCVGGDGTNVVSFGDLESGILARTCIYFREEAGSNRVTGSDIQVNKADYRWTTRPRARSCKGRYDLEAVVTHERGHTFGLGHVLEKDHPNLTMSGGINGPCQMSERSLGRGDVLGLDRKYR